MVDPGGDSAESKPSTDTAPPRRFRGVLLLAFTVSAALAGWWVAARLDPFASASAPNPGVPDRARGELRFDPERDTPDDAWLGLFTRPGDTATLGLNPLREPLDREPADLSPYPGAGDAVNETRYRIADGPWIDEVSFWRVSGDDPAALAADLMQHYRAAARRAGFGQPTPNADSAPPGRSSLSYFDTEGTVRSLSVQIREQTGGCHVTIWLRYEAATP